ncbi:MAG: alpha/beta fold hydrolase, partial [Acidobacteria bacterium]|nr:alpha/beta fold hydrolase [Acidobacteriota bacterium]
DRAWARCLREEGLDAFFARWDAQPLFASRRGDRRALRAAHDAQELALAMETFSQGAMPDHRPRLGDLTMPAIVMAGARDAKFVALAREVVTAMPRARLDIVPDAGHDLLSERPHEVARALDQIQEASRA